LAKWFASNGFSVDLLLFTRKGRIEDKIDKRINIIDLKSSRIILSIFEIAKYLKKQKPVAILGTSEHANLVLITAKLVSFSKTKIFARVGILFSKLFENYKKKRDRLIPFLIRILYPRADMIIANSKNVALDLEKISGIPNNKIKVIYNPKFLQEIKIKSQQGEWSYPNKHTILAVGRLDGQKHFEILIKAFDGIRKEIDAQLIILGEGGERKKLEKLVKDLELKDVYLPGFVQNPYFYMKNASIIVSTSIHEGFSNVLIEAGILGLAVIATDCGSGTRELLAPNSDCTKQLGGDKIDYADNGILIASGNHKSLSKAMLTLLKDDELRAGYSKKIKDFSQKFDSDKILQEFKKLFLS
jgi:glycosyltransferase involved in cell wall biosynthesis